MHIMVNKRYMWKFDTCAGHEALISKLLLEKPPGIMSAGSTSGVCEEGIEGIEKKVGKKEGDKRQ